MFLLRVIFNCSNSTLLRPITTLLVYKLNKTEAYCVLKSDPVHKARHQSVALFMSTQDQEQYPIADYLICRGSLRFSLLSQTVILRVRQNSAVLVWLICRFIALFPHFSLLSHES